jgi:hypothetical protein
VIVASLIGTTGAAVAVGGLVGVLLGTIQELRQRRGSRRALELAAVADKERAEATDDPRALYDYLVDRIGPMSVRAFADDHEARRFVFTAASRADAFLNSAAATTASRQDHLTASRSLIKAGEIAGGLARLRLGLEQEVARWEDSLDKVRHGGLARRAVAASDLPDEIARSLSRAVRIANGGVHGEPVSQEQALQAWEDVARATAWMQRSRHATPQP